MIEQTSQNTEIDNSTDNDMHMKRIVLLGIAFVLLIAISIVVIFSNNSKKDQIQKAKPTLDGMIVTPTLIPHPVLGSMTMSTEIKESRLSIKKPVSLIVAAVSEGKNIVGYDTIISYDKEAFSYTGAQSLLSDFTVYPYERPTHVAISAIKSLQSNTVTSWDNTPVLRVTFQPKKTGTYTFYLSPKGPEASKMMDDKAQATYPETSKLVLDIYDELVNN